MTLTLTTKEIKEELGKLHGVPPEDIVIIESEQNLEASFFLNLKAGQTIIASKIIKDVFKIDLTKANKAVKAFHTILNES